MAKKATDGLTRAQAGRILRKARMITALASELGCHRLTVSSVLRGRMTSKRVLDAAMKRATELAAESGAAESAA